MRESRRTRKAMDKLNGLDTREKIWEAIREKKTFTISDVLKETILEVSTVREYVSGLTNAGFIKIVSQGRQFNSTTYELVKDIGVDAPRVRKDGSLVTQGQGRINMWRTMQILRVFSAKELAMNASTPTCTVKVSTSQEYIRYLVRAGYLIHVKGRGFRFLTSKFTGPKPPMIQRLKRVFDPNIKKVVWSEDKGMIHDK